MIGDLIGSGSAQEQAVVGKTPNLAARLQGIAAPNMVVVAEKYAKLVGNLFEVEELETKDLKGNCGAYPRVGGTATEFSGKPFRGSPRRWFD